MLRVGSLRSVSCYCRHGFQRESVTMNLVYELSKERKVSQSFSIFIIGLVIKCIDHFYGIKRTPICINRSWLIKSVFK